MAWSSKVSIGMCFRTDSWVPSRNTGGAASALAASSQRWAQRHQRSPGLSPGNPCSGRGVIRSLPFERLNMRNSRVIKEHTICNPRSLGLLLQQPSRKKPVMGSIEQVSSGRPSTFLSPCATEASILDELACLAGALNLNAANGRWVDAKLSTHGLKTECFLYQSVRPAGSNFSLEVRAELSNLL